MGRGGGGLLVTACVALCVAAPARAPAALPGANGRIVFETDRDGSAEVYAIEADRTGLVNVTQAAGAASAPAAGGSG